MTVKKGDRVRIDGKKGEWKYIGEKDNRHYFRKVQRGRPALDPFKDAFSLDSLDQVKEMVEEAKEEKTETPVTPETAPVALTTGS